MRKEIYHVIIHYQWRTARYVKGVYKPSKKWNEAKIETTSTELDPKKMSDNPKYINRLRINHKSSNDIEIKVTDIVKLKYLCMSNDVY